MLPTSLSSLQRRSSLISQEALAVHRTTMPLLKKLVSFVDDASIYVKEVLSDLSPLRHEIGFSKVERRLNTNGYEVTRNVQVPIPAGLSVSYLEYLEVLRESQKLVIGLYDDTLRPFSIFVGACLNDPERMQQLINTHSVKISDLEPIKEKMAAACKGGNKSEAPLGKHLARNSDWPQVESQTNALMAAQKQIPADLIIDTVNEIDEKLVMLVNRMSDTNEHYRPTPALINDLSELTYMLAEKVTFFAVYSAQYTAFTVAMDQAVDTLSKKLK